MKGKDEGPAVGPPRLLAAVRCARAALLLSSLKSASPRSVSVAAALEVRGQSYFKSGVVLVVAQARGRGREDDLYSLSLSLSFLVDLLVLMIPFLSVFLELGES